MRIFEVEFNYKEKVYGRNSGKIKTREKVTAKNCIDAILKVEKHFFKSESFTNELGQKTKIIYVDYDPINVTLIAESQY